MKALRRCPNAPAGHTTLVIGHQCVDGAVFSHMFCISDQPVSTPWEGGRENDDVMQFKRVGASAFSISLGGCTVYTPGTRVFVRTQASGRGESMYRARAFQTGHGSLPPPCGLDRKRVLQLR